MYNEDNQLVDAGLLRLKDPREVCLGRMSGHSVSDSTKRSIAEDTLSCVTVKFISLHTDGLSRYPSAWREGFSIVKGADRSKGP